MAPAKNIDGGAGGGGERSTVTEIWLPPKYPKVKSLWLLAQVGNTRRSEIWGPSLGNNHIPNECGTNYACV